MKINKKNIKIVLISFLFFSFLPLGVLAKDTNYGLDKTVSAGGDTLNKAFSVKTIGSDASAFLSTRVGSIIGALLSFLGVLFMALVIYGGILWMTARGSEKQVEQAKNLLVNAIVGLIIVLAAYAITAFVGGALTDAQPVGNQSSEESSQTPPPELEQPGG